jgi:hypothetical protein
VVAPLVVGALLLAIGWFAFLRPHPPGRPWVRVLSLDQLYERQVATIGSGPLAIVVRPAGDPSNRGATAQVHGPPCHDVPVLIYRQVVYVNPADPLPCTGSSPAGGVGASP